MAAYALEDLEPVMIMSAAYTRYEVIDLDSDDVMELVVLRSDETESGGTVADYYDWDGGSLQLRSSARLSTTPAELQWVQTGTLESGETALFVTGRVTGVEETSRAVTDILTYREPDLTNIVLSSSTGVSTQISRFLNLQPTDVNGDSITEVPRPAELLSTAGKTPIGRSTGSAMPPTARPPSRPSPTTTSRTAGTFSFRRPGTPISPSVRTAPAPPSGPPPSTASITEAWARRCLLSTP